MLLDHVQFTIILDGITILDKFREAQILDLRNGSTIANIKLNKKEGVTAYTGIIFINSTEQNLTYAIMTNIEVRIFEREREIYKYKAALNDIFFFMDYNYENNSVVVGVSSKGSKQLRVMELETNTEVFTLDRKSVV